MKSCDNKLDRLYDCHDKIEAAVSNLHSLFEKTDMSDEAWYALQVRFDKVNLELLQLEKELHFS